MVFVCFRTYCFIKLVLVHVPDILNQSPSLWRATYTIVIISHACKRWWPWFAILEHAGMLVYNNVIPSGHPGANRIVVPLLISYRFFPSCHCIFEFASPHKMSKTTWLSLSNVAIQFKDFICLLKGYLICFFCSFMVFLTFSPKSTLTLSLDVSQLVCL